MDFHMPRSYDEKPLSAGYEFCHRCDGEGAIDAPGSKYGAETCTRCGGTGLVEVRR